MFTRHNAIRTSPTQSKAIVLAVLAMAATHMMKSNPLGIIVTIMGFAMMLGLIYWGRYVQGRWETMRVIESE